MRRWLIIILILLMLYQAGAVIQVLRLPDGISKELSIAPSVQLGLAVLWLAVFAGLMIQQSTWRILYGVIGFLLYSLLRLMLFAQAQYDRQRLPFWIALTAFIVMILISVRLWRTQKDGEMQ